MAPFPLGNGRERADEDPMSPASDISIGVVVPAYRSAGTMAANAHVREFHRHPC